MDAVKNTTNRRAYVELTAYWGNDDAESTIKIGPHQWREIQDGGDYSRRGWGWYEGRRFSVSWSFGGKEFSIGADDGMECVLGRPISDLIVQVSPPIGDDTQGSKKIDVWLIADSFVCEPGVSGMQIGETSGLDMSRYNIVA